MHSLQQKQSSNQRSALLFIVMVGLVGAGLLLWARAAVSSIAAEAEVASLDRAVVIQDSTASASQAVRFGSADTASGCSANGVAAPCVGGPTSGDGSWNAPVFADEFNGPSLDKTKWSDCLDWGAPATPCSSVNNVQTSPANVTVSGGNLVLKLSSNGSGAAVDTRPTGSKTGIEITNGYYAEARIRFSGSGSTIYNWPAWWTTSYNWPSTGEYDIAEGLGGLASYYHFERNGAHVYEGTGTVPGLWANEFHTYGLERRADVARVYWDGRLVRTYTPADAGAKQYFILNVGYDTNYVTKLGDAGSTMVDYVRIWKKQ